MKLWLPLLFSTTLAAQSLATVEVVAKPVERTAAITAEIQPFLSTPVAARVAGYLESISVDRGSAVKQGQTLARVTAPELLAEQSAAEAKVAEIAAQTAEAEVRVATAQLAANRLRSASQTAGAIAANELEQADQAVKVATAAVEALRRAAAAAQARVTTLQQLVALLAVKAPFDGIVTARQAHPGMLVGPAAGPLLHLEQLSRLRIIVAVPEALAATVRPGLRISFRVTAYPGETFSAPISRFAGKLDPTTRTLPVELDFPNPQGRLSPGMYTEVTWPARAGQTLLLVPPTAIASNTERTFVIRVEDGRARYVNVRRGAPAGDLVEVFGPLKQGDRLILRATDEIREGAAIPAR